MRKYKALYELLSERHCGIWSATFSEIEDMVIRASLPKSARRYRQWWENGDDPGHSQSQAWLKAGWHTEHVDLPRERVTFRRDNPDHWMTLDPLLEKSA